MPDYRGKCHCGEVEFSFASPVIDSGLRCNCSICKRLGFVFSLAIAPDDLQLLNGRESLNTYQFGARDITHHFCSHCGIYVYYTSEKQVRVNLGCVDAVDTFALRVHNYDGRHLL